MVRQGSGDEIFRFHRSVAVIWRVAPMGKAAFAAGLCTAFMRDATERICGRARDGATEFS